MSEEIHPHNKYYQRLTENKIEREVAQNKDLESQIESLKKDIKKLENKINNSDNNKLVENIHKLDLRIHSVEVTQGGQEKKWNMFINFGIQLLWVIMAAYLLFKLGLEAPL